jgi:SET domain
MPETSSSPSVHTFYKSHKISFETTDTDYKYVKAVKSISEGDILLFEHALCSTNINDISEGIQYSPELFNSLYPRTMEWSETMFTEQTPATMQGMSTEFSRSPTTLLRNVSGSLQSTQSSNQLPDILSEKVQKNCFSKNNTYYIGKDVTKFNHLEKPNALCRFIDIIDLGLPTNVAIMYIIAIKDIPVDEEILIWYGNAYFNENHEEVEYDTTKYQTKIESFIPQYIKKPIFESVTFNHLCAYYGLYIADDTLYPTYKFFKYYEKEYKQKPNAENVKEWLKLKRKRLHLILQN